MRNKRTNSSPENPPALPSSLRSIFNSLPLSYQSLFIKVLRYLWRVLSARRYSDPITLFWGVDLLRVRYGLTSSELQVLTWLYLFSERGANVVNSDDLYNTDIMPRLILTAKLNVLNDLKHKNYIIRYTRDPGAPYLSRSYRKQPVFIKLTSQGVALIKGMEKELNSMLLNSSLDELAGNKKPRPS
jgi:hypothetical protein